VATSTLNLRSQNRISLTPNRSDSAVAASHATAILRNGGLRRVGDGGGTIELELQRRYGPAMSERMECPSGGDGEGRDIPIGRGHTGTVGG
jgi:hypothetical protein